ncbi:MAG: LysM peptidoglycan-binding domain-containing protein [Lactococcus sp.]|uniref:Extracellular transglycosylase n=1 Tax=Pseudolactococcus piscium MKFS47 TaxID=297352 RepID=A0A0D6DUP5_9LACT|nr:MULTISPECIES: LysM peptidoglycan-binding domain-containing protein [Lactococcus]MDN5403786.1 LysM peptidoglycan-binding domain-containing protein [Lactococcus sp.]MDN5410009.1 LysM peptidoglycan-binding domain-containing protein [Lactococcus sp.]MDN5411882.1 LysM peptidoglycan-binding domain-containing protein [Lactococcus sp.]MDN5436455.1 LysM peptidoglycan-binding domain-containing protein [Lactococcus sp.]MDN5461747.1 LysM peptidoglycan-binding domain-containing protein [Lactococcus sp.]
MSILTKNNTFKKSHKILFALLTIIGIAGLAFGITIFFILGSGTKYEAETQKNRPTSITFSQVTYKHAPTSQVENNKSSGVTSQTKSPVNSETAPIVAVDTLSESDEVDYIVQDGDSLSLVSEKFKTSVASIMQQSKLKSQDQLYSGQHLKFLKSYIVKEEVTPLSTQSTTPNPGESTTRSDTVAVDNGNKVVPGGLSKEDRTYVLSQLQSRTGVSASQWDYIISRESGWLSSIKNTIGYYGLFQLAPNYPGYDGDVDAQINGAVYLFNNGGMKHWAL